MSDGVVYHMPAFRRPCAFVSKMHAASSYRQLAPRWHSPVSSQVASAVVMHYTAEPAAHTGYTPA
jgi:hypothetical protein